MSRFELAQLNVAAMKAPLESPAMADFVANLDRINALAEGSPGFVWRLQSGAGDATAFRPLGETTLVNLSVWRDVESLKRYVYGSAHAEIMRRRQEWFDRMRDAYVVLWWVPAGHRPDLPEAIERLERLRAEGPTPAAFTLRRPFAPLDSTWLEEVLSLNAELRGAASPAYRAAAEAKADALFDAGRHLLIYGSLAPGEINHGQLAGLEGTWTRGWLNGERVTIGWGAAKGYPALHWRHDGPPVPAWLFRSAGLPGHWPRLDSFEGADYVRLVAPLWTDQGVAAIGYVYCAASNRPP